MKLRKKIYLHIKGFIFGVLGAPIIALYLPLLWIYDSAVSNPRREIFFTELKEKKDKNKKGDDQ